ncbi:MAG: hypothetical protein ABSG43_03610, partial [Solirubrobacteraceae bacterium]
QVTAIASTGATTTVTSAPVGPVTNGTPAANSTPTITGTAADGDILTAQQSFSGNPYTYAYQWQRQTAGSHTWTNITAATASTYTATKTDEGAEIRFTVTATNSFGSTQATSAQAGPVAANPPVGASAPAVTGTPQDTNILLTSNGTWSAAAGLTFAYQWQTSPDGETAWTNNPIQTADDYPLTHPDVGRYVRVLVTATNPDGTSTQTSNVLGPITPHPPVNTVAPTISGTAQVSDMLMAQTGTWTGPGISYFYPRRSRPTSAATSACKLPPPTPMRPSKRTHSRPPPCKTTRRATRRHRRSSAPPCKPRR